MQLAQVEKFVKGAYPKKYTAVMKDGTRVHFGDQRYEHYRDAVPKRMGGGLWTQLDHNDPERRKNYRLRHAGVRTRGGKRAYQVKYSPSWFSYNYLW